MDKTEAPPHFLDEEGTLFEDCEEKGQTLDEMRAEMRSDLQEIEMDAHSSDPVLIPIFREALGDDSSSEEQENQFHDGIAFAACEPALCGAEGRLAVDKCGQEQTKALQESNERVEMLEKISDVLEERTKAIRAMVRGLQLITGACNPCAEP